jgi:2-hydroxychromene-2-carboxylate isomerase
VAEQVDVYYDFRSPYAYFAARRIMQRQFVAPVAIEWRWRPVSIDILLNLQAGRDPHAPYSDPLAPPKRRYLVADVRRCAAFYQAPLVSPHVPRPDPVPALCVALLLERQGIRSDMFVQAVFDDMWARAGRIDTPDVLARCLQQVPSGLEILEAALLEETKRALTAESIGAYEAGIFGVPSFVFGSEVFFGADRLDLLGWRMQRSG